MEFEVLEDFKKDIGINMEKQFTNNPTFMMQAQKIYFFMLYYQKELLKLV